MNKVIHQIHVYSCEFTKIIIYAKIVHEKISIFTVYKMVMGDGCIACHVMVNKMPKFLMSETKIWRVESAINFLYYYFLFFR